MELQTNTSRIGIYGYYLWIVAEYANIYMHIYV